MQLVRVVRDFFDFALDDKSIRWVDFCSRVSWLLISFGGGNSLNFLFRRRCLDPRGLDECLGKKPYYWSIHWGPDWYMDLLFQIQIALAVAMGFGVFPRVSAFLGWFLLGSLVLRNPLMVYGGDKLSTLLLLAFAFVPTGSEKTKLPRLAQFGGFLYISQLVITYCAAGAAKLGPNSWQRGEALLNAFHMNLLVKPLGVWLSQWPELLYLPRLRHHGLSFFGHGSCCYRQACCEVGCE